MQHCCSNEEELRVAISRNQGQGYYLLRLMTSALPLLVPKYFIAVIGWLVASSAPTPTCVSSMDVILKVLRTSSWRSGMLETGEAGDHHAVARGYTWAFLVARGSVGAMAILSPTCQPMSAARCRRDRLFDPFSTVLESKDQVRGISLPAMSRMGKPCSQTKEIAVMVPPSGCYSAGGADKRQYI